VFDFGPFRLDVDEQLLLRDGQRVLLQPKAFDLLVALLSRRGRLVRKDELLEIVWPGTFVADANLSYTVSIIRKALREGDGTGGYIETVPKRGYRFRAGDALEQAALVPRIAILPFEDSRVDRHSEYLSAGIVEGLINAFACLSGLSVVSRATTFSYKGANSELSQIGDDLDANALLTGTLSVAGDDVGLQTELIDPLSLTPLWGKSYSCSVGDLEAVQHEIVKAVAEKLGLHVSGAEKPRLKKPHRRDPAATRFYLEGQYFWRKGTVEAVEQSLRCFDRALAVDPRHAQSYAGIANAYITLSDYARAPRDVMPMAREAALRALAIDEACTEAHLALGVVRFAYEWDPAAAARSYALAKDLSPGDPEVHHALGWHLVSVGRCDEALSVLRRARELEPLLLQGYANLGAVLYLAHDFASALAEWHDALELDPSWYLAHYFLGLIYQQLGRNDEAVAKMQHAHQINDAPMILAALCHVQAASGRLEEARQTLAELNDVSTSTYVPAYEMAAVHAGFGDLDATVAWLESAVEARSCMMAAWFRTDPRFDRLRGSPRFHSILQRLGSPA
jgi:DNA-binding winged helix-turn-helix (wHTH) protein/Tfp pilus assembly protein PilF